MTSSKPVAGLFSVSLLSLALLAFTTSAKAQTPPASSIDQLNNSQLRRSLDKAVKDATNSTELAPELYPGEADDAGPQSVLAMKARRTWFDGYADVQYFYSDNALLDSTVHTPSGVLVSTIQAALAPTAYPLWGGASAPRIGVRQQWYNYLEIRTETPNLNSYDFVSQTAFIDERWSRDKWTFSLGLDANRLVTPSEYHQFYREFVPRWEATRLIELGLKNTLALSYLGNVHVTRTPQYSIIIPQISASYYDRMDQVLQASLVWNPCEYAIIQPFYSFRYTHYISALSRDDKQHTVGLSAFWFLNSHVTLRTFSTYEKRESNVLNGGYQQFTLGAGVNLDVKF